MTGPTLPRPAPGEYNDYYERYISAVPDGDVVLTLRREMTETQALLAAVPVDLERHRYAPGKWSIREVVGHVIDAERLFAFRALWFARQRGGELEGMDQEAWAVASTADARPLSELAAEWAALRETNALMFGGLSTSDGAVRGTASGYEVTVRALAWMIAGHELHHRALLKRDYLGAGS